MKAFLSHSSKDKIIVRKVADYLGLFQCEYDEYTFERILNAEAIRRSLLRSDLFVLFLSENSVNSKYISEECRAALEARASGRIQQCLVVALDNTSYRELPLWLQETNVCYRQSDPKQISRKIASLLTRLEDKRVKKIVIPREEEEKSLRTVLGRSVGAAPVFLHLVGFHGVGRKTLISKTILDLFPGAFEDIIYVNLDQYEGARELYRRLVELHKVLSFSDFIETATQFDLLDDQAQADKLLELIKEITNGREFIVVEDNGAVLTDEGKYQPFMNKLIEAAAGETRPLVGFIQTRRIRGDAYMGMKGVFQLKLEPMTDEKIADLLRFNLRDASIDYNENDIELACKLLEGIPLNAEMAINYIVQYGLKSFVNDPSAFVAVRRGRMEEFLSKIVFTEDEMHILSVIMELRFLNFELVCSVCNLTIESAGKALRNLEDLCCISRRGEDYTLVAPLIDPVTRDKRFFRDHTARIATALKIIEFINEYKDDQKASLSLIEIGVRAEIVSGGKSPSMVSRLILPSYLITMARRAYDALELPEAIEYGLRAWNDRESLSDEGKIEILRILGLSYARQGNEQRLEAVVNDLAKFKSKRIAKRNLYFLQGFYKRLQKRLDEAERFFLKAHEISADNISINRELANLYRLRGEYVEGEQYARKAYAKHPTNPFIIDVFLECLLGKMNEDMNVSQKEIEDLFGALKLYGDVEGSSFYQTRVAQQFFRQRKYRDALAAVNIAISRTPAYIPCRFLKANICLKGSDTDGALTELRAIEDILTRKRMFNAEEEARVTDLTARIHLETRNYSELVRVLKKSNFLPHKNYLSLKEMLRRAVAQSDKKISNDVMEFLQDSNVQSASSVSKKR